MIFTTIYHLQFNIKKFIDEIGFGQSIISTIHHHIRTKDYIAVTHEVYEHIIYDKEQQMSLASLPEMQMKTIITSSLSNTCSMTDSAPAPFEEATLTALTSPSEYYKYLIWISSMLLRMMDAT